MIYLIAIAALILSLISIAITLYILYTHGTIDEVDIALKILRRHVYGARRSRRIKRYVLLKVVCLDPSIDMDMFIKSLTKHIRSSMGSTTRFRCDIALISYSVENGRAILRVTGDSLCLDLVLATLSIRHFIDRVSCLTIPIRVSGLVSRLRKFIGVFRAT